MADLVSVIVPSYNMARYVGRAVESVLEGEHAHCEVVVIDDGSTDGTSSVLRRYTDRDSPSFDPRVRCIRQPNQGKSVAVNHGLEVARGDFVTFLDADDELTAEGLAKRAEILTDDGDTDVVIGGFELFDGDRLYGRRPPPPETDPRELHRSFYTGLRTPFCLNACLLSRDVVARAGGYDEALERCVDGDYALKVLATGPRIDVVDEVVYRYRKHRDSPASRLRYRLKTARDRIRVMWRHYEGIRRWAGIPLALATDGAKLAYEAFAAADRWA